MNSESTIPIINKNHESQTNDLEKNILSNNGPTFGKRHSQAIILAIVIYFLFLVRSNLTVAIVAMTDPTATTNSNIPTYNWTDKSLIMSSFLWGYSIPQVGAGYLADRYGAKWILICGMCASSIAGLLIPPAAATFSSQGVMACRVIQGLSQGFVTPSVHGALGKWIPSNERSRIGTFVYSGAATGITSSMLLTGYISASSSGWPSAFYIFNSATLIVCALYAYAGYNNPSSHPTISEEEKKFIITNLNTIVNREHLRTPWKEMLTSAPFLALITSTIAYNLTHWALITQISLYLKSVLSFDIKSNGVMSSLPYIAEFLFAILSCCIADFLITKKLLSTKVVRKLINNLGFIVAIVSLYLLGNIGPDDRTLGIVLIILVGGSHGSGKSGYVVNHMDLAPNFTGIMMGIANGTSVLCSLFAPVLAQIIITEETNVDQWKIFFYIIMGVNIVGAITNTLFTSGTRQVWNQGSTTHKGNWNIVKTDEE